MTTPPRPTSLHIGIAEWSVEYLTAKAWKKRLGSNNAGETHPATHSIYVVTDHPSGQCAETFLRDTVLHEILHACFHESNIRNTMQALKRGDLEEAIVGAVSGPLLSALRDNPALTKWLLA